MVCADPFVAVAGTVAACTLTTMGSTAIVSRFLFLLRKPKPVEKVFGSRPRHDDTKSPAHTTDEHFWAACMNIFNISIYV